MLLDGTMLHAECCCVDCRSEFPRVIVNSKRNDLENLSIRSGHHEPMAPQAVATNAPKGRRAKFQFSLRVFLIFAAVVSFVSGLVGLECDKACVERKTIANLPQVEIQMDSRFARLN